MPQSECFERCERAAPEGQEMSDPGLPRAREPAEIPLVVMNAAAGEFATPQLDIAAGNQRQSLGEPVFIPQGGGYLFGGCRSEMRLRKSQLVVKNGTPGNRIRVLFAKRMNHGDLRNNPQRVSQQPQPDRELVVHSSGPNHAVVETTSRLENVASHGEAAAWKYRDVIRLRVVLIEPFNLQIRAFESQPETAEGWV